MQSTSLKELGEAFSFCLQRHMDMTEPVFQALQKLQKGRHCSNTQALARFGTMKDQGRWFRPFLYIVWQDGLAVEMPGGSYSVLFFRKMLA